MLLIARVDCKVAVVVVGEKDRFFPEEQVGIERYRRRECVCEESQ